MRCQYMLGCAGLGANLLDVGCVGHGDVLQLWPLLTVRV